MNKIEKYVPELDSLLERLNADGLCCIFFVGDSPNRQSTAAHIGNFDAIAAAIGSTIVEHPSVDDLIRTTVKAADQYLDHLKNTSPEC